MVPPATIKHFAAISLIWHFRKKNISARTIASKAITTVGLIFIPSEAAITIPIHDA